MLAVQPRTRTYPVLLPEHAEEPSPRRRRPRRNVIARALAVAALVVLPAVFYVSQRAQAARTGYLILQLRHEIDTLQGENARLLATATALKSLDRIERIATKELGMRPPGPGQVAAVTVPAIATTVRPVEARSLWDRLGAWFGRREAEAREPGR